MRTNPDLRSGGGVWGTIVILSLDKNWVQRLCWVNLLHLGLTTFRFHLGKPNHFSWFSDSRTCPWLPEQILFYFGGTQILQKYKKKNNIIFGKYDVGKFSNLWHRECRKDARQEILTIRLTKKWKFWIRDQYLSKGQKSKLCNFQLNCKMKVI